LRDH